MSPYIMASPQVENGFIKIAHEVFEMLTRYPFSRIEIKVINAVLRFTWGYHKKEDRIPYSKLCSFINPEWRIKNPTLRRWVSRIINGKSQRGEKGLIEKGILIKKKEEKKRCLILSFNKDYDQWLLPNGKPFITAEEKSKRLEAISERRKGKIQVFSRDGTKSKWLSQKSLEEQCYWDKTREEFILKPKDTGLLKEI